MYLIDIEYYSVKQVAAKLGKHVRTIRAWCDAGALEHKKVQMGKRRGQDRLFKRDYIDDLEKRYKKIR